MNTQVLIALIPYAVPSFIGLVVYVYHQVFQRLPEKQRNALEQLALPAVQMVAQVFSEKSPEEKKELAIRDIKLAFKAFNLPVPDDAVINTFIESAVFEMNRLKSVSANTAPLPQISQQKKGL